MGERGEETVFNSFFSNCLNPAETLSLPSGKWKGALTTAVSSSAWCALQKGHCLAIWGQRGGRLTWGSWRKKLQGVGRLKGDLCKRLAQGLLSMLECSREGSRVTKSCLWLCRWVGGGWSTPPEVATSSPVVKGRGLSQCLKCAGFLCSWAVVLGWLVLFLPFPVCFGRAPGRNKIAGVEAADSISV